MPKTSPRLGPIAVVLEGGLVSAIVTHDKRLIGIPVVVIDYDVDGVHPDDVHRIKQEDGTESEASLTSEFIEAALIEIPY